MNIDYVNNATQRAKRITELSDLIQQGEIAIKRQTFLNARVPINRVELLKGHQKELEYLMGIEERCRELINEQKKRLDKGENIRYPVNTDTSKPMQELPVSPKKWQGNKNDLAELIYALDKSERIKDTNTGEKVTQKNLIEMFEFMFGVELNYFSDLVTKKLQTFESREDGKTFINELKGIIDERIKELNPPK